MGEHNCYKERIAKCVEIKAYELWEKDGRKQGHDLDNWLNAEKTVRSKAKKQYSGQPGSRRPE